eukprot:COSAG02_NODE_13685_length_1362_cov_1.358670_2_plen_130_part_00
MQRCSVLTEHLLLWSILKLPRSIAEWFSSFFGNCTAVKRIEPQEFYPIFVNFYSACEDSCFAFTVLGINSIVTWLKLLKYLNAFPYLAMMSKTVANALAPSFSFMVMFFIFFIGCAQAFTLVFGGNLVR